MKHFKSGRTMSTKTLAVCALLAALNIVLARLIGLMPDASTRFSIEAVPVVLAGMLFGPLPGAMVGFVSDFVGCLFTPFGYNPLLSLPPILYGLFGGIFRPWLLKGVTLVKLFFTYLPSVVFGSVLYQSAMLAYFFYSKGPFLEGFLLKLSARSVQFAIVLVLDVILTYLLFRSRLFEHMGFWPAGNSQKSN